jgi:hypothetical protein
LAKKHIIGQNHSAHRWCAMPHAHYGAGAADCGEYR